MWLASWGGSLPGQLRYYWSNGRCQRLPWLEDALNELSSRSALSVASFSCAKNAASSSESSCSGGVFKRRLLRSLKGWLSSTPSFSARERPSAVPRYWHKVCDDSIISSSLNKYSLDILFRANESNGIDKEVASLVVPSSLRKTNVIRRSVSYCHSPGTLMFDCVPDLQSRFLQPVLAGHLVRLKWS